MDLSFPTSETRRGRVQGEGNMCPTLLAGDNNVFRIEKGNTEMDLKKLGQISTDGSQCGSVYGDANSKICTRYRIRKLTPLECFRLMGMTNDDFENASKVNVNTHLYSQAGNSIVVNVLAAIFGQMIPDAKRTYVDLANVDPKKFYTKSLASITKNENNT